MSDHSLRTVSLSRLEKGRYLATNRHGVTLELGGDGTTSFSPVELLLAAIAGIIHAGQLNQGSPNDGVGYELDAIAAVVIGGTSLMGGIGGVPGTLAGALLLGILNNVLALNNIDSNVQLLIKGVIIVAAAGLQAFRSTRR